MIPPPEKPLVLVTGSSGLIGTRVIESLCDRYRVVGLDLKPPQQSDDRWTWIECDLTDDQACRQALEQVRREHGSRIASVVHLAAYYDFSGEPSPLYQKLTVEGTRRLLRALQAAEVEQFIFSSTLLVMKPAAPGEQITADSPTEAEWDYPQSKLDTEQVIEQERGSIPALVLRLAGAYDEQGHSVPLAQQMARIFERQMEGYFFPGNKRLGQSFIHLDDCVDCIGRAIELRGQLPPHATLVVGEEDVMSYEELQDKLGELLHGREWPTLRIPKSVAKAGAWAKEKMASDDDDAPFIKPWMIDLADQNYPVDMRPVRELLRWEPRHTLRGTLPDMVRSLRKNPRQWYEENGLPLPEHLQTEKASR